MLLNKLFKDAPKIDIKNIMVDSRQYKSSSIYFCIKGLINDGHKFIDEAIQNGAIAIVYSDPIENFQENITYIKVDDVNDTVEKCMLLYYYNPSEKMTLFGVTGTNGKTSVTSIIRSILKDTVKTGYIGTLGIKYNDKSYDPVLTTPTITDLYRYLDEMRNEKIEACAIEVSSISLQQKRTAGLAFKYAIFTNFTHDHLDFHRTLDSYFEAKKLLFDGLSEDNIAIVNIDDSRCLDIIKDTKAKIITYGINNKADLYAKNIIIEKNYTEFDLVYNDKEYHIRTNLVALFNVYNILASVAAVLHYGIDIYDVIKKLNSIDSIEGRLEVIDVGQPFNVIIDFAHTPDGIENLMRFAKSITREKKRIIVVTGSAGKRDTQKRIEFGILANKYCNMAILTEDDPRDEKVVDICNEIKKGITDINYLIVEIREEAIRQAIELANSDDTILILGKGNEKFIYREKGKEDYQGDDTIAKQMLLNYGLSKEENDEL